MAMPLKHSATTAQIIKAFYAVYNTLGYGFVEKVYHQAMMTELRWLGVRAVQQQPIHVFYRGIRVGEFFADIVVEDCVIVELKTGNEIHPEHRLQLMNYLKASRYEVGLLMNFGKEAKYERKVFTSHAKGLNTWSELAIVDQP